MMLYVAGGCGEHGRNCFMASSSSLCFLVDCGIMAEEKEGYPRLNPSQIGQLQCVFLTHSHADHTGALPWLFGQGFDGDLIATGEVLAQLPFSVKKSISLESLGSGHRAEYFGMRIEWGRSGHCVGSVWYHFFVDGKSVLFSGDYTENTQVYAVDQIRDRSANFAVLDCAYGKDSATYDEYCEAFLDYVRGNIQGHIPLVLPVPKYGRGLELLKLITKHIPDVRYLGDEHFMAQLENIKKQNDWFQDASFPESAISAYQEGKEFDILFLSDPQLKNNAKKELAKTVLSQGGVGIMTGTAEKGTYSYHLLRSGKMKMFRYPVHQSYGQYEELCRKNRFLKTVAYHTPDLKG